MRTTLALASVLALATGCNVYFGGGDDDCQWGGGGEDAGPADPDGLRNPYTGMCEYFGGGGGGGCDDPCSPCEVPVDDGDRAPEPSWGYCTNYCSGLDEQTCLATSGCRGGYIDGCYGGVCDPATTTRVFYECWSVDQTGPVQGPCENLDAWTCSLHDDCVAVHQSVCAGGAPAGGDLKIAVPCLGPFESCQPETSTQPAGCYDDSECAAEDHCNAAEVCLPPPGCGMSGEGDGIACPAVCYGWCVPDETVPACEELIGEASCLAREDCQPIYEGIDCTNCDSNGNCTCADYVYSYCSSM